MSFKLLKGNDLINAMSSHKERANQIAISLAFSGLVHGDTSVLCKIDKTLLGLLPAKYRVFIPAKYVKDTKEFAYDKEKAKELAEKLNTLAGFDLVAFQKTKWEDFRDFLLNLQTERKVKDEDEKKADARKRVESALKSALKYYDRAELVRILDQKIIESR